MVNEELLGHIFYDMGPKENKSCNLDLLHSSLL